MHFFKGNDWLLEEAHFPCSADILSAVHFQAVFARVDGIFKNVIFHYSDVV